MKYIQNSLQSIGGNYPRTTGRLKQVIGAPHTPLIKVALLGDSTLDNGYWVQQGMPYAEKTHTVTHQIALAFANNTTSCSYEIGNFAVDGATTADLMRDCRLNKVLPWDDDHPFETVHQLNAFALWGADVAVLSVAGNNYREALMDTLSSQLSYSQLLLRITPKQTKPNIRMAFQQVKATLLEEYKCIIDNLISTNPKLSRIVLLSQYYPAISEFTPYFIYTGFSHLARSEGKGQDPFTAVEETINGLYQEVLQYAATKNKEIVFVDVTSSLNPLGGNHTHQIEPNEHGAKIMGQLIVAAVEYSFSSRDSSKGKALAMLRMPANEKQIRSEIIESADISKFKVKRIEQFISENRYHHLGLFFAPSSSLRFRYECSYHLVMGNQFDNEYKGLFAFGLLDLSLVTVIASYLWRVAINEEIHTSLRVIAGVIAAPILLCKMLLSLSLMLALALPIYAYDKVINCLPGVDTAQTKKKQEKIYSLVDENDAAILDKALGSPILRIIRPPLYLINTIS